jgi:hypothetical protein
VFNIKPENRLLLDLGEEASVLTSVKDKARRGARVESTVGLWEVGFSCSCPYFL